MKARSFSHTGITVTDFNRAVRFWWDVFGCPLVGVSDAPADRVQGFFGVDAPKGTCKIGWIRIPGGAVIEIFHFEPQQAALPVVWRTNQGMPIRLRVLPAAEIALAVSTAVSGHRRTGTVLIRGGPGPPRAG